MNFNHLCNTLWLYAKFVFKLLKLIIKNEIKPREIFKLKLFVTISINWF